VMRYDPGQPHHLRYVPGNPPPSQALGERMVGDTLKLCRALGYDLNTVEFAVEDGVPYAIDFMNPAPDAGLESVGPENFRWIVEAVADMAISRALGPPAPLESRGAKFGGAEWQRCGPRGCPGRGWDCCGSNQSRDREGAFSLRNSGGTY